MNYNFNVKKTSCLNKFPTQKNKKFHPLPQVASTPNLKNQVTNDKQHLNVELQKGKKKVKTN